MDKKKSSINIDEIKLNEPRETAILTNEMSAQRKNAEKVLLQHEYFKKTIQSSIDGFWIANIKGEFLSVNNAYCQMTGYSENELLNMSIKDVENVEPPELVAGHIKKIIKNRSGRFESRHCCKDGSIIEVEVSATYSGDEGGLFFVFIRDITEKKLAQEKKLKLETRLQQSQKMESMGTLAGGIAHDFNNILFSVIGHAEILIEDVPEDSPLRGSLDEIYAGSLRARELVQQILTFARQEPGELKLMKIQPVIKEVLKLIRSTIPTTIAIKKNIQADCGAVRSDPTYIHQIVMNLITNAWHAMEETGGTLTVDFQEISSDDIHFKSSEILKEMMHDSYACLTVSDTGQGMDEDMKTKIFDPFFSTKKKDKGTGMGLSVVNGLVAEMDGDIQVETVPGSGTDFHIYIPIVKSALQ